MREKLPNRRESRTIDLWHKGERYHVSYSRNDTRIAEVFMHGPKAGSDLDALSFDVGVAISLALQYGTDICDLRKSVARLEDGQPASIVGAVLDRLAPLDNLTPLEELAHD